MEGANFKTVTHVIFDLDGLLLDTEKAYKMVITEILASYKKEYTHEMQMKVLGTTEQDTARIIVETSGIPITPEQFRTDYKAHCAISLQNASLLPGAENLIRHLYKNKIPFALATSSSVESMEIKTKNNLEFFSLFHHKVMGSSDPEVKKGKPSPDIFLVCASRFDEPVIAEKCLVFEDAPNGVTGAISAGMQAVMVPDKGTSIELTRHATIVLDSLEKFQPELFGLPAF